MLYNWQDVKRKGDQPVDLRGDGFSASIEPVWVVNEKTRCISTVSRIPRTRGRAEVTYPTDST